MGGWAQAITQGLGRAGGEAYNARLLGLDEQAEKLKLLQAQMGLQELKQRMGLGQLEMGLKSQQEKRQQEEFELRQKLENQPKFLGFQKVGGRVIYGLQNPDGTITTKEAEGFNDKSAADYIENGLRQLPLEAQGPARASMAMWLDAGDYEQARKELDRYLLQYGKSQLPGQVTTSDTTTTVQIDTPNGPMVVQVPKRTVTQRGPANRVSAPGGGTTTPGTVPQSNVPRIPGSRVIGPSKPAAQEMNRADLAENMSQNLDELEEIVKRRPDLFGPGRGLLTAARGFIGTGDQDIASLKAIHDFLGRASQGAHGMRAARGVAEAADAIMAGFRNSAPATLAAIQRGRTSLKTFEDDIRKDSSGKAPQSKVQPSNATVEAIVKALSQGGSSGGSQPK